MNHVTFDLAVLRSFVAGMDLGSFAKAADRVGRSTSAISAQIRKLEEQAGIRLFRKSGRGLALTDAGEVMLAYARRLVELNDEASVAVRGVDLEGWIRLGLQEDFGEVVLPDVLGRFARAHPKVRIEARVARNTELLERIDAGQLDLALVWGTTGAAQMQPLASPSMRWIGSSTVPWQMSRDEPLPLIAFDRPCLFHSAATAALDRAGIKWRVAFTSPSLSGLWAAAAAGLGVTVRTCYGLPATVRALDEAEHGLPTLPAITLALHRAPGSASPPIDRLASLVVDSVRQTHASAQMEFA
ncbi:LysR substrate-binding domain-containing protein [Caballeronia sp. LZ062]|uniref:LysR substrate-binding domain-containing protein n=1 Tax=unclassified Caballeronia TaxID=2646786 RepID=UPI00285B7B30|nr:MULTISPECIES: LysR substrate-binding domain-containing protein [unclassified Caballeronia]MDR5856907.1 LysR substrate-binding domain-containing protein [Caballeronia sp. LZ050]MDR5869696.1 LysR substrate-binding domain-containing protein [Caballeronia sp. LZ062]